MILATTKERLLQYLEFKRINRAVFYTQTDMKRGLLDADKLKSSISDSVITKIIATYTDLNVLWLLTGNGNMLKTDLEECKDKQTNTAIQPIQQDDKTIDALNKQISLLEDTVVSLKEVNQLLKDKIKTLEMGLEFARTENKSDVVADYSVLMSATLPKKRPKQPLK